MTRLQPSPTTPALDRAVAHWRSAFRAARLAVADAPLRTEDRAARVRRLGDEVSDVQELLRALAHEQGLHSPQPLVLSTREARRLLRLPHEIGACVFNLDGVLVPSAALHSEAWAQTFDGFLLERTERTHGRFSPFNPHVDYPAYLHGRPRLDGVRAFLASRGIRLREGSASDAPGTETVHGLANRKNRALLQLLDERGVAAFDGAHSYLELAHEVGIRCAVVSASENTQTILERSGLTELVDDRVDAETIRREHLRVKPEPDTLLAACSRLGIEPRRAAAFETTRAGVRAGRAAGFDLIVGVDGATGADRRDLLRAEGADVVVSDVGELLEHRLAA
jgi:beta-phosphoglucomutase family hydrolase